MKVFDLIIKQYNNEYMPKNIKINRLNYTYDNNRKTYKSEYGEFMSFDFTNNVLNMEVELIEDEIDIDNIKEYKQDHTERCIDIDIRNKMNEILQAVKQIDKRVKKIEEK